MVPSASRVAAGPIESIAPLSCVMPESPAAGSCRVPGSRNTEALWPPVSLTSSALLTLPLRSRMWTTTTLRPPVAAAAEVVPPRAPVAQR